MKLYLNVYKNYILNEYKSNIPFLQAKTNWSIFKTICYYKKGPIIQSLLKDKQLSLSFLKKKSNKLFPEQCTSLKKDNVLPTSKRFLNQSKSVL